MAADFAVDVTFSDWQRQNAVRGFRQTYAMIYGFLEKADANFFRVDPSETQSRSPAAAVLRDLTAQIADGAVRLRASRPDRSTAACVSLLLERTARRDYAANTELTEALTAIWAEWDRQLKVPSDEQQRLQLSDFPNAQREQRAAEARRRADAELKRDAQRAQEQRDRERLQREHDELFGVAAAGSGGADHIPAGLQGRRT